MTHILTAYGREHFFASAGPRANASSNIPVLREMCHSLANINRYTGHTRVAYSVAEHSLLVARIAREMFGANPMVQLLCLLHDGHECITGDVASPIKQELGEAWHRLETREQTRFLAHYDLVDAWYNHHAAVKHCDLVALATERRDLLPFKPVHHLPWPVIDTPGAEILPAPGIHIHPENETPIGRFEWATLQAFQLHTAILQTARAAGHKLGGRVELNVEKPPTALPAQTAGMKERPILFSAPMVRALLDGSKTQTRRIVKPKIGETLNWFGGKDGADDDRTLDELLGQRIEEGGVRVWCVDYPEEGSELIHCPYGQPGDRLWVRETHYIIGEGNQFFYKATGGFSQHKEYDEANGNPPLQWHGPWKPSIFMPRHASRITLEITGVRVERLQDINAADAISEGIEIVPSRLVMWRDYSKPTDAAGGYGFAERAPVVAQVLSYRSLWESINGPGSWDANSWVWVVEFKKVTS